LLGIFALRNDPVSSLQAGLTVVPTTPSLFPPSQVLGHEDSRAAGPQGFLEEAG
jgi:hypothetical protein